MEGKKKKSGKEKKLNVEFRQVYMERKGKTGKGTAFRGLMGRATDESGKEIAVSVCIEDFGMFIWSGAPDLEKLNENMVDIVELMLEDDFHKNPGVFTEIAEQKFFYN